MWYQYLNNVKYEERANKKCELNAIKSNVDFYSMTIFSRWFEQSRLLDFFPSSISFFVLNELCHQIEFRIILKQFQNKFERPKRTDKNDTENGKMFCQQQSELGQMKMKKHNAHIKRSCIYMEPLWKREMNWEKIHTHTFTLWWREWIVRREATAQTMSTFYIIAFLVAKLNVKNRKVVRDSHLFMLLLCDFLRFFIPPPLSLPLASFFALSVFCFEISIFVMRIPFGHFARVCCLYSDWMVSIVQRFSIEIAVVFVVVAIFVAVSHFHWTPLLKATEIWQFKIQKPSQQKKKHYCLFSVANVLAPWIITVCGQWVFRR